MKTSISLRINASVLPLIASAFLLLAYNVTFWKNFVQATGGVHLSSLLVQIGSFLLLLLICNVVLTLLNFRFVIKPILIFLFLISSLASYFMSQYGTAIDSSMIQNVLETDLREGSELLSWKLVLFFVLLGLVPSLALWKTELRFSSAWRDILLKLGSIIGSLLLAGLLLALLFKSLAPALREHREMRFLLTPSNYIQAVNGYIRHKWSRPPVVASLGRDASKGVLWTGATRRTVSIIVVGETARAMNFSLNHYSRNTNPRLAQQAGLVNFSHVQSCGTATAISVPCVFSALTRKEYSETRARSQEGLLDVLRYAGFSVVWRDNNSGCKGVCNRVAYEDMSQPVKGDPLCNEEECFDERLLSGLPQIIHDSKQDLVIVLHQKGSHGPSYWKRYPPEFKRFKPVCETNELAQCSRESIVAAYDNTILYTDYVLSKAIALLEQSSLHDNVDTSLIYFSDHGESLGENNMYLHGAPYIISPLEQRHVPMLVWLSNGFSTRFGLDTRCLAARHDQEFSHDNIFHSTLGMLGIGTAVYNPKLDLFHACRHGS